MREDPLGLHVVLEDGFLRLEPLAECHRAALREACGEDQEIWEMYGVSYDKAHFDTSFGKLLVNPQRLPFAVFADNELAGMTAWIGTNTEWLTAEIGNTYLRPRFRGGRVNTALKRLMHKHGFACGLKRMFFSVDTRNKRSMAACEKNGAVFEGILRNHMITWTGYLRDSAIFSVVERDRERLGL